jgi:hypothetical protein
MNKQILTDIMVVLIAPVCFIALYHFLLEREVTTDELLAIANPALVAAPGSEQHALGEKSKALLNELRSINFDESVFSDPVFLSLVDFTPPYASSTVGRPYPFSAPSEVLEIIRRVQVTEETESGR